MKKSAPPPSARLLALSVILLLGGFAAFVLDFALEGLVLHHQPGVIAGLCLVSEVLALPVGVGAIFVQETEYT